MGAGGCPRSQGSPGPGLEAGLPLAVPNILEISFLQVQEPSQRGDSFAWPPYSSPWVGSELSSAQLLVPLEQPWVVVSSSREH